MRLLSYGLAIIFLCGCASSKYGGETLSQLRPEVIEPEQNQMLAVTAGETIDSYRELMAFPVDNPFRPRAMHRLADLLLDYGEEREIKLTDKNKIEEIGEYSEAITIYEELLATYPDYPATDQVLYQLARAYDKKGEVEKTNQLLTRLVTEFPHSRHIAEAQFRLGELNFVYGDFEQSARSYRAVLGLGKTNPYYEHSLLKYSWALFKQEQLDQALESFFSLIQLKLDGVEFDQISGAPLGLSKADDEIIKDTLRGITLIFVLKNNANELDKYARLYGHPGYNHLVYQTIAEFYNSEQRYLEAARTYSSYIAAYPESSHAAIFYLRLVDSYRLAREFGEVIKAEEAFLTQFWLAESKHSHSSTEYKNHLSMFAKQYLDDLSKYYHSSYQKSGAESDYQAAIKWYQLYLANFHSEANSIEKQFLLAELLYEHGDYQSAGREYEQVAYFYPVHNRAADAGYSAILSYKKLLEHSNSDDAEAWRQLQHQSALRFISAFPKDARVPETALALANDDFEHGDMVNAGLLVDLLINGEQPLDDQNSYAAWMLLGYIAQQEQDYLTAEQAFLTARQHAVSDIKQALEAEEWRAISIYKQAELKLAAGDKRQAVELLLRIPAVAPSSEVAAQAKYDAAAELITLEEWQQAGSLLEDFQNSYPAHELQAEVPAKLAFVYMKLGRTAAAAKVYEQIAGSSMDTKTQQEALLQAAQLYQKSDDLSNAALAYKRYLQKFPGHSYETFQVRSELAGIYALLGQTDNRDYWYKEIISNADYPDARQDDAIQLLAAQSAFALAEDKYAEFESVKLVEPIRTNLAQKKQKMEQALEAFELAGKYGYAEFVTASTYRIGEIYFHLSRALLESERPSNLDKEELEQYEIMLEEQAYPFEEKAIDIFQTNVSRIKDGIYNEWIDQTFVELAKLLPAQYAKQEQPVEVIDVLQ